METRFKMTSIGTLAMCLAYIFLVSAPANATLYDLTRITSNGSDLVFDTWDFQMDIAPHGEDALFTFSNNCDLESVVTAIVFSKNDLIEFREIAAAPISSEGVSFSVVTNNAMLPAGNQYGFTPDSAFAVDADAAGPKNGLRPGESLGLLFDLTDGTTFDMLTGAFNAMTLRAGIHVQALPGDYSESFISTVPEPTTLALLGIGTLLIRNKRRGTAQ